MIRAQRERDLHVNNVPSRAELERDPNTIFAPLSVLLLIRRRFKKSHCYRTFEQNSKTKRRIR